MAIALKGGTPSATIEADWSKGEETSTDKTRKVVSRRDQLHDPGKTSYDYYVAFLPLIRAEQGGYENAQGDPEEYS